MADLLDDTGGADQALVRAYRRADMPLHAHLDVTYRCDLDCVHCYLDDKHWPEMTPDELRDLLHQLRDAGVLILTWSGGELFLRPDVDEALALAASLGFVNRIKTHAGNLTQERVALLARSRVSRVDVSVYSLRPEIHDAFVRRPGALLRTLDGISLLRQAGLPVRVSMTVQANTLDEMEELYARFAADGCEVTLNGTIRRDHSATSTLDALQLSEADLVRVRTSMRQLLGLTGLQSPPRMQDLEDQTTCGAGRTAAYIAPDGSVWPCVTWPMALGNVREQTFGDIWRNSPLRREILAWTNKDRTGCLSCVGNSVCFYCPGEAFKRSGDFRKAPDSFHAETRARLLAFEATGSPPFTAEEWATVPDGGADGRPPDHFVFPIHRAQRGGGRRVKEPSGGSK
jgi:radical SAM protein with 4Fe4S-binding SPASM domain